MGMRWVILAFFAFAIHLHGDVVVVASDKFPSKSLTETAMKRLFLGHLSFYRGERITLHQLEGEILKKFCEDHLKVSLSNYERRWARRIFTGKGRVPRTFKNESSLLKSLLRTEHGLAFVSSKTELPEGVRIIPIVKGDR